MLTPFFHDYQHLCFSNTSAGLGLDQRIPERQLQSHQPQTSSFKSAIPPKSTKVKPYTVNNQINPISLSIIRPKHSKTTSSIAANFTEASHSNSSQPYAIRQPNTMYLSPHQRTIPSKQIPPAAMATQPPISTNSSLLVQTQIPVLSFRP